MHSAELELGAKLAAQQAAENKLTDDQAALDAAKGQLPRSRPRSTRSPRPLTWVVAPTVWTRF
ncbi:hypothetical protein I551_5723 [Mycobacterium ulcerans str. Harvey]|uniref:Uncharacterized protein n=1 Tax=Mycobacterium ulcerans str. Harvey TaxID=1299332 RepID=A0ABP3A8Q8_MYCUL|nr:hypothetical protein I551_5723 [Mycobacterium ulcerans str. Harvey]